MLHAAAELFAKRAIKNTTAEYEIQGYLNATNILLEEMGIMQHHDAATGTAKQYVANDYNRRLHDALQLMNNYYAYVARMNSPHYKEDTW